MTITTGTDSQRQLLIIYTYFTKTAKKIPLHSCERGKSGFPVSGENNRNAIKKDPILVQVRADKKL